MATYSHSKLSTFEQCPYKYKLKYIDKEPEDISTTIEMFMGDIVHKTLEKLYSDLKFSKLNSLYDLKEYYNDTWKLKWSDNILVVKEGLDGNNYKTMGIKYIEDYYNHYNPFDQLKVLGIETMDKMLLPDGSYYHVRIDKLACKGNIYYVCDYKTNSRLKDQEEADNDRQLAMYSLWVKDKFKDAEKVILLWNMLAFDKEVTSCRSDEQLNELMVDTMLLIKEIENCSEFNTSTSALCNYCGYKSKCSSFKHEATLETKEVELFKEDDGVKFVDEYSSLISQKKEIEERLEELKEKMIKYSTQESIDIIYGSNMKASVKAFPNVEYSDKDEVVNLLKKKGLYEKYSMLCTVRLNSS
ncbi:MAG TPA: PD-(D/E)XK nuclease family protein [Nanoarchaeota archaeon]|nr:PD-(D/E)XK nuclease family protein [Candidatus Woesearchaeota archaeon]HIH25628.1 PD-(D/E)XK nuclease family protein [Nanoarchaeota archaeon]HIJ01346.1 PD-(D/E)XK nuclease family protein [Candidatus Woesearchaeota archaeon]